jgi:hypothetical protein
MSEIESAIVGAISALMVTGIKDFLIPIWSEKRSSKKEKDGVFERYSIPLAKSSESLMWRLDEIINGRAHFLHPECPKTTFYEYKRVSTCYRLAVLLGWIRAINQEISLVSSKSLISSTKVAKSIGKIQNVLADGGDVETQIVKNLMEIWRVHRAFSDKEIRTIGADTLHEVDKFLSRKNLSSISEIKGECADNKQDLLFVIRDYIDRNFHERVSDDVVLETMNRASESISIIEAWIYRDWQDAIGDMILVHDVARGYGYKPMNFSDFEISISDESNKLMSMWNRRIYRLFSDLDIQNEKSDMRVRQIRRLYESIAELIIAIYKETAGRSKASVSLTTREKAEKILELTVQ